MSTIQIYDKPMCCSTGVCGPQIDPVLPRFAADLQWLQSEGHSVERFNLAQQPAAFVQNPEVHELLSAEGTECLPLIAVNGRIVSRREYPSREILSAWMGSGHRSAEPSNFDSGRSGGSLLNVIESCCAPDDQAKNEEPSGCCSDEPGCC